MIVKGFGFLALLLPIVAGFAMVPAQGGAQTLTLHALACPVDYPGDAFETDCAAARTSFLIGAADESASHRMRYQTDANGDLTIDISDLGDGPIQISGEYLLGAPHVTCAANNHVLDAPFAQSDRPADGVIVSPEGGANEIECQYVYLPKSGMTAARPDRAMTFTVSLCPENYAGDAAPNDCAGHPVAGVAIGVEGAKSSWRISNADGRLTFDISGGQKGSTNIVMNGRVPELAPDAADAYDSVAAMTCRSGGTALETQATHAPAGNPVWKTALPPDGDVACDLFLLPERRAASQSASSPESGDRALTIHARFCPRGYSGSDYYADCHDNGGGPSRPFAISGPVSRQAASDEAGDVVFRGLPPGSYTISDTSPGTDIASTDVFCSVASNRGTAIPIEQSVKSVATVPIGGEDLLCDWYMTPAG